jgi:hypothetical protein
MATNVSTNVKIGRVKVYTGPTSTADPVMTVMPTGSWQYLGWMGAQTSILATQGLLEINVDDLVTPVDTVLNSRVSGLDGILAEWNGLLNINVIQGGTLTSVAATTGVAGYDLNTIRGSDDVSRKAVHAEQMDVREVMAGSSLPVGRLRIYFPNASVSSNGNIDWSRKKESGIPFSVRAHPALDGSEVLSKMYAVTAAGT